MANIRRSPIFVKYWRPSWQQNYWIVEPSLPLTAAAPAEEILKPPSYDYPLPPLIPYRERAGGQSSPGVLVAPPTEVSLKPPQYDYPLPPIQIYREYGKSYSTPYTLTTVVVTQPPFVQDDWPVPQRAPVVRAEARSSYIPLLHSIKPPTRLDQWPVPVQPYRVYAQCYSSPLTLGILAAQVRAPNYSPPIPPYRVYARSYSTSLTLTVLPPVVLPPIAQRNWPTPVQLPRIYAQSYSTPYTLTTVVVITQPPIAQSDWPVPQRPPVVRAEAQSAPLPLLTAPVVLVPSYEWLPPPPPEYRAYAQSYSSATTLLTPAEVVQPPFSQEDWPLPRPAYRVYATSYSSPQTLTFLPSPFSQEDWPLPKRPPIAYAAASGAFIPLLHSIQPPISQQDWPLPGRPYIVRSVSYGTPTTLLTPAQFPFAQDDWPLPRPAYRVYAEVRSSYIPLLHSVKPPPRIEWLVSNQLWRIAVQPQTTPLPLLAPAVVVGDPFKQRDWPVPITQGFLIGQVSTNLALGVLPSLPPEEVKPFAQNAWPVPFAPPKVYAQSYGTPLTVRPPGVPVITEHLPSYIYPLPPPRPYKQYTQTVSTPTPILVFASVKPFLQRDWPLPKRPGIVRSEARNAEMKLLHSVKPPNRQNIWPLPPQRAVPQLTSGFVRGMVRVPPIIRERAYAYIVGD